MARRFCHTEGLIIGYRNISEGSRLLLIMTDQLGLVWVLAQGVREDRSKLRLHLFSWRPLALSLVRGREIWRLVGAEAPAGSWLAGGSSLHRLGRLISRLVPLETPVGDIYRLLKEGVTFLNEEPPLSVGEQTTAELLVVVRLLTRLGYLPDMTFLPPAIISGDWRRDCLPALQANYRPTVQAVNDALFASQL